MLTLISPPTISPISRDEAKQFLRVDGTDDDALITTLVDAAVAGLDGERGELGRALLAQTWRLERDCFPRGALELPLPPTISVDAVSYVDTTGAAVTMAPADYVVTGAGSFGFARITPTSGCWPAGSSVSVTFRAGFGETAEDVPADLRAAILSRVALAYGLRESAVITTATIVDNPETAATIARWRASWW
jgi:uncharacterized phiE125 gp8 family phage protein